MNSNSSLFSLKGKKAIVTGAARDLAHSMAEALMRAEAEVMLVDISPAVESAAAEFREKGFSCYGMVADISSQSTRETVVAESIRIMGGLDILVNAAGIQIRHKCEEFPIADWEKVININLTAVFSLCQLAGKHFLENGGGKIINIASMLSYFGGYTVPAYAASKGGVAQITKALSNEWADKGINVNALAPGYMDTDMNVALVNNAERNQEILNRIPAKRWGQPSDMDGPVVFLASAASNYLNGAIIPVDGGYLSR